MKIGFDELDDLHKQGHYTLSEIRLIIWIQENDLELNLGTRLLEFFTVAQIKEILCIPGYWPRFEEFVKENYHPIIIGLIRDLCYFDYCLESYNFDCITSDDAQFLRWKIKLPNLYYKFISDDSEVFEDDLDKTVENSVYENEIMSEDVETIDDLLMLFQDPINEKLKTSEVFDQEKKTSDEEYFLSDSEVTFKKYIQKVLLKNAILIDEEDEKIIIKNVNDKNYFERFFNGNIKLALHYAKRYSSNTPESHHADIMQVAFMGLIKAIEQFDSNYENKFSTYAHWPINQKITRYIQDNVSTIRIPVHKRDDLYKLERFLREYRRKNMVECKNKSIMNEKFNYGKEELENNLLYLNYSCSIEELSDSEVIKLNRKYSANSTRKYTKNIMFHEIIKIALDETLTEREVYIIRKRFGLDYNSSKTLEELGEILGLSRERVRQIQSKAIKKLSENLNIKTLVQK